MKYCYCTLFLIINLLSGLSYAGHNKPIVCKQEYALCTSAPCIPDPQHPDYAICSCVVENGNSIGYKNCKQRMPEQKQFKAKHVVSTFSFEQFNTKKSMTCAKGTPWTDCVDAPCTVNQMDSTKAICNCKIRHDQSYFTLGGDCDTKKCATGFWSGSTTSAGTILGNALLEVTKDQSKSIVNSCSPVTNKQ